MRNEKREMKVAQQRVGQFEESTKSNEKQLNASTLERLNVSTLERLNASTLQRLNN